MNILYEKMISESDDSWKPEILVDTMKQIKYLSSRSDLIIPESFDARIHWPKCASLNHIKNLKGCQSDWATIFTSMMSDRVCIHSDGKQQPEISAQDLIECCPYCGDSVGTRIQIFSLNYWKKNGIVSGNFFGLKKNRFSVSKRIFI